MRLLDGRKVVVMAQWIRPEKEAARALGAYRDLFLRHESIANKHSAGRPVVALYGERDDGSRMLIEMALSEPPAEVRSICTTPTYDVPAEVDVQWNKPGIYLGGRVRPLTGSV